MSEQFITINGKDYVLKRGKTQLLGKEYLIVTPCPNGKIRRDVATNLGAKSYIYDNQSMTCWL